MGPLQPDIGVGSGSGQGDGGRGVDPRRRSAVVDAGVPQRHLRDSDAVPTLSRGVAGLRDEARERGQLRGAH